MVLSLCASLCVHNFTYAGLRRTAARGAFFREDANASAVEDYGRDEQPLLPRSPSQQTARIIHGAKAPCVFACVSDIERESCQIANW